MAGTAFNHSKPSPKQFAADLHNVCGSPWRASPLWCLHGLFLRHRYWFQLALTIPFFLQSKEEGASHDLNPLLRPISLCCIFAFLCIGFSTFDKYFSLNSSLLISAKPIKPHCVPIYGVFLRVLLNHILQVSSSSSQSHTSTLCTEVSTLK